MGLQSHALADAHRATQGVAGGVPEFLEEGWGRVEVQAPARFASPHLHPPGGGFGLGLGFGGRRADFAAVEVSDLGVEDSLRRSWSMDEALACTRCHITVS